MHARIDQLLSLRDGEPVDVALRAHVESCFACAQALARTETLRRRLTALSASTPPVDGWERLRGRLAARAAAPPQRRWQGAGAFAASFVLLGVVAALLLSERTDQELQRASVTGDVRDPAALQAIDELRDRSRLLEEVLAALPARPAVERAGTAMPIDTLQAQVQWVDHQISVSGVGQVAPAETERLWRERVDIMNTLVQLRYVEAQRVAL